jgi:GNAT superfamily N-acetyltransferase
VNRHPEDATARAAPLRIVDVTDAEGAVLEREWLGRAEAVHRQLRPQLPSDYAAKMLRVFAGGGRLCVAARGDAVVGVAVYRIHENTFDGRQLYVDDLVADEARRSEGVGEALLEHLQKLARASDCRTVTLDSGTQRQRAHRFYFRHGWTIVGFHFSKPMAGH